LEILVVDDRVEFRQLLSRILKELGPDFKVEEVEDGATAINLVKVKKFDCVLLDYILGDSTGTGILKKIREVQPEIPIVIVTAHDNLALAKSLDKAGASGFISKSDLSPATLAKTLQEVVRSERPERQEERVDEKSTLAIGDLKGMKVLVVDDTPANIGIVKNILSETKLNISFAPNGEVALDLATKNPPDLILLDIMMPGIDGFETCRQLKANIETQDIPIIFISARNDTEDFVKGFSLGAVDYISKPFREEEVLARVHTHLQLRKLSQTKDLSIENLSSEVASKNKGLEQVNKELLLAYEQLEERVEDATSDAREKGQYLENISNHMLDGLITISPLGAIQSFNPAAEKLFGYSASEVFGKNVNMLMPEPYKSEHDGYLQKYLNTGKSKIIGIGREVVGLRKDGSTFPLDLGVSVMASGDNLTFIGTVRDISIQKRAEEILIQSEARFRAILDNALDAIITINEKGIIETFNPSAGRIFGYESHEVIGEKVNILMPEPYRSEHDQYMERYLKTKIARIIGTTIEISGMRKNGEEFPLSFSLSEATEDHRITFTGIIRDVTQQKKAEAEIIKAREEAERANHAKSEFLSSMSHELRTPLNAIMGFSQLLTLTPKDMTPDQLENIKRITNSGEHLLELINEVLDLARVESGQVSMSIEPLPIGALLDDLMLLASPLAIDRGINISYMRNECSDRFILADKTRLKQVLLNLISNAIKYNKDRGAVKITLDEAPENLLRISVTDTGLGIPEEQQEELFEAFNRLGADQTEIEGTGIGLNITKKLVELMNGTIGLDSTPGQGSCFYVELPFSEAHHKEEKERVETPQAPRVTSPETRYFDILYVEDNSANLELVKQILMVRENINMFSAPDASLGIDLAISHQPDLILMDINLPGMSGIEAFKILRNTPDTSQIPVIAVSANAMERDIRKAMATGFVDYIAKPFNVPQFLEKIDKVMSEDRKSPTKQKTKGLCVAKKALVVEDIEDMGVLVQQYLLKMGFKDITYVKTVKEGIQKLSEDSFDLILLDWFLDEDKGSAIVEHLENEKQLDDAPLIIVTSYQAGCEEAADLGIKNHLVKPFGYEIFRNCVVRVLEEH
jgi:PAS domain S-box-containing protein